MSSICYGCESYIEGQECSYKTDNCPCMTCVVKVTCKDQWYLCEIFKRFEVSLYKKVKREKKL